MQTLDQEGRLRSYRRARAGRVLGAGVLAGLVAVAVNLAVRAAVLAALDRHDVPFPLAFGADIIFTFLPSLLGTLTFLVLRRMVTRPVRWFTVAAATVVILSWVPAMVIFARGVVSFGVLTALMFMHTVPAAILVITLRRVDRTDVPVKGGRDSRHP